MSNVEGKNAMLAAMKDGKPYRTYKKTILAGVFVEVWDNFVDNAVGMILKGDPNKNDPDCFYHAWTEQDDAYFRRVPHNRRHLELGEVIPVEYKVEEIKKTIETSSDAELKEIVNSKFLALRNSLNKTESVAVLYRILNIAREEEKSEKIIKEIEARLSEVQEKEFNPNQAEE